MGLQRPRGESGFTLIEMLVVLAILAVLSGVVVLALGTSKHNAHEQSCMTERSSVIQAYAASNAAAAVTPGVVDHGDFLKDTPGYFSLETNPTTGPVQREGATLVHASLLECPEISVAEVPLNSP